MDYHERITGVVKEWTSKTLRDIKHEYELKINGESYEGYNSLRSRIWYHYGEPYRIGFQFKRYLIYVHKGVGRGNKINDPNRRRRPIEWLNPVLEGNFPSLADRLVEIKADLALKNIQV